MTGPPPKICPWINEPKGKPCGANGTHRVEVHTELMHGEVWLCNQHEATHSTLAYELRKSRRRRPLPSTGGTR